jgi:uncharacterized protein (TIGR00369 family)
MSVDLQAVRVYWETHQPEFAAFLDLQLEDLAPGSATMRLPYRAAVANGNGAVHGGAIATLCDTVFFVAHATVFGWEQPSVTTSLTCNYLAAARKAADLIARATVIKRGRSLVYGEVSVHDDDRLVAHATLTYFNVDVP